MHVITGDVSDVLPLEGYDACFCDPPYGLKFMGKAWDHGVPSAETWRKVFESLKPGASLLAFGGTRTHHRLMVAIEDAGFEIRDCLMWLYGSGFPKSYDISKGIDKVAGAKREVEGVHERDNFQKGKAGFHNLPVDNVLRGPIPITVPATDAAKLWDGYGTALKPAWEPIVFAMKPCDGTFANNALTHGVAGLNVDGGRIEGVVPSVPQPRFNSESGLIYGMKAGQGRSGDMSSASGRWPANVILDEQSGEMLDASGGASRFFYCAKASRAEREAGLSDNHRHYHDRQFAATMSDGIGAREHNESEPSAHVRNHHPTVKPLDLCRYLATLIKPPNPGKLLVPFSGSGSEMIGAYMAGWSDITGIERRPEYVEIAEARIAYWTAQHRLEL